MLKFHLNLTDHAEARMSQRGVRNKDVALVYQHGTQIGPSEWFMKDSDAAREMEGRPPERDGRSWWGEGVELPHGTKLRMKYGPCEYTGVIHNGHWLVEGREYGSPSGAAGGVAVTKKGQKTHLDGWIYWEVKRPFDQGWVVINRLR